MYSKIGLAIASAFILCSPLPCTASDTPSPPDANTSRPSDSSAKVNQSAAIEIAKMELAKQISADASTFKIHSTQEYTWPDSSLGCGKPNQMAAQVVTSGFIVTIESNKGTHIVHATERYAVICERNIILRNPHGVNAPSRNLDAMIDKARADLADKLHAQPALIRTMTFIATEWPDTSMGCVVPDEQVDQKNIKGYRIALNYRGRTFVYHTDLTRVRACPPVEAE